MLPKLRIREAQSAAPDLDVFALRDRVVGEYHDYFESFVNIRDDEVDSYVRARVLATNWRIALTKPLRQRPRNWTSVPGGEDVAPTRRGGIRSPEQGTSAEEPAVPAYAPLPAMAEVLPSAGGSSGR